MSWIGVRSDQDGGVGLAAITVPSPESSQTGFALVCSMKASNTSAGTVTPVS